MQRAWKIRTGEQVDRIVDIVKNRRLYCAQISSLNDPQEGTFVPDIEETNKNFDAVQERIERIKYAKVDLRICSLSLTNLDLGLWQLYGNSGTGAAVGVMIKDPEASQNIRLVTYENFDHPVRVASKGVKELARDILTRKSNSWANEEEVRVFTQDKEFYNLSSADFEIVFGQFSDAKFIRTIVQKTNTFGCKYGQISEDNGVLFVEYFDAPKLEDFLKKAA